MNAVKDTRVSLMERKDQVGIASSSETEALIVNGSKDEPFKNKPFPLCVSGRPVPWVERPLARPRVCVTLCFR